MVRIKNIRPGVLVIPGHRLRLAPGGVAKLEATSPEVERAIAAGLLVRLDGEAREPAVPKAPVAPEVPAAPATTEPEIEIVIQTDGAPSAPSPAVEISIDDLVKLPQNEVVPRVASEKDPKRLRALLAVDKRPRVQDAIRKRLSEVDPSGAR